MTEPTTTEVLMELYDLATKYATKEGKPHREVFQLLCEYIDQEVKLASLNREIEAQQRKVATLDKEIGGLEVILTALREGKVGEG